MTARIPRPGRSPGHLDARAMLSYIEGTLAATDAREAETHLAGECGDCRERLREFGLLLGVMRGDRTPTVPAPLHARAMSVFRAPVAAPAEPSILERMVRLLFDSNVTPAPAAVRRAVGDARRLRYGFAGCILDLERETQSAGVIALRGRLDAPDAVLHCVRVEVEGETRELWPDANGNFAATQVPAGTVRLRVDGPTGVFEFPPIEP